MNKTLISQLSIYVLTIVILSLSACTKKVDSKIYVLTKADSAKLDLTSYPEIRKEVLAYMHKIAPDKAKSHEEDSGMNCKDDNVAVGPEGLRSIGHAKWKKNFDDRKVSFKKVVIVPGTEIVRLYCGGKTAVRNVLLDVTLDTPIGEVNLDVMRLETYIKNGDTWCMVAGQGTQPFDREAVMQVLLFRILGAFLVGCLITYLIMRWRRNKV